MPRLLVTAVAMLFIGAKVSVSAQTRDELLHENAILRAQLAAMQLQVVGSQGAFHDHGEQWHEDDGHDHSRESHHSQQHGCALTKDHCEPHFDYCLPFEDHHGGHGCCDLCGSGDASGYNSNEDHHGHAHGPAYHHSIDGYPILHSARTEFFFIERHVHLRLADVRGTDGGEVERLIERDRQRQDASEADVAVMEKQLGTDQAIAGEELAYRLEADSAEDAAALWQRFQSQCDG